MLKLSKDLSLPVEAVCDTFAILAIRGAGKSHTASVMAEEMLKAGQPIVAYDPTGAWFGLKSSADGKRAGFPVVVFGGEHADVPLEETAGDTIATTIVERRAPAILDCSLMRKAARIRFMTDFAETLYHKNREPLHLFLDEAQTVAPQNIRAMPEASRLLGAIEDIILQGRRRGLGLTAISPRPAVLNANVRSACQTLIAMRVGSGKLDRKAIEEWVEAHGDHDTAKAMMTSLASLPTGDAWVWNPPANIFKRVHFRERETFDSSATPKVGGRPVVPQRMAAVDLEALGEAIKATVERAKSDDPNALKARIRELENAAKRGAPAAAAPDQATIDRAVTRAEKKLNDHWEGEVAKLQRVIRSRDGKLAEINKLSHLNGEAAVQVKRPSAKAVTGPDGVGVATGANALRPGVSKPARVMREPIHEPHEGLTRKQQQILDALLWWESIGVDHPRNEQLGAIALIDTSGGHFSNVVGPLSTAGLVERGQGETRLTEAGRAAAQPMENVATIDEYHDMLRARTKRSKNANGKTLQILDALIQSGGREMTNEEIGESVGIDTSGGHYSNCIGPLGTLGLVERRAGVVRPTELLFPPGLV